MYGSSSFSYSTIRKVSLSTWITMLSTKYKYIIITACIWSHLQVFSFMMVGLFSYMRASISLCWISTYFTLVCQKEKLLFPSNRPISNLIMHVLSIFFNLDQSWTIRILIPVLGVSTCTDITRIEGSLMRNMDSHSHNHNCRYYCNRRKKKRIK